MSLFRTPVHGRAAAAGLALAALAATAATSPASAGSMTSSRSSGSNASAEWIEWGVLPGPVAGNVHVGSLYVDAVSESATKVYGQIVDWTCPEGERPPSGGHHFDEPHLPPTNCVLESFRSLHTEAGQARFVIDKKLATATLTGTLEVSDHGSSARPPVNMTWTGVGTARTTTSSNTETDGTSTYRYTYDSTTRSATVGGSIGTMGFTDDADDESSGQIGTFKNTSRIRVR